MAKVGIVLARYLISRADSGLGGTEQAELLDGLNDAQPVAYRVRDPQPDDRTNYIIQPASGTRKGFRYLTWRVCKDLNQRTVRKVDRTAQSVTFDFEPTDDCLLSRVVAIPSLGVMAAEDGTGDGHIGGWSSIKRFGAIVEAFNSELEFSATLAGTPQDLERAITTWELDRFTFEARPFNPHPSNPGLILSDLMAKDGIGQIRGVSLPRDGKHIEPNAGGLVKETLGLAAQGYAVYGAEGRTPSGAHARVRKPQFSFDRDKNQTSLAGPQQLRVVVEAGEDQKVAKFADVLIDFFAPKDDEQ